MLAAQSKQKWWQLTAEIGTLYIFKTPSTLWSHDFHSSHKSEHIFTQKQKWLLK